MSKILLVPYENGGDVPVVLDDLSANYKCTKLNYIRLFYLYSKALKDLNEVGDGVRKATIELESKIVALSYFSEQVRKQAKILFSLRKPELKNPLTYTEHQIFLAYLEAYLNSVHSINDYIKKIDVSLKRTFSKDIFDDESIRLALDIRNIFHCGYGR